MRRNFYYKYINVTSDLEKINVITQTIQDTNPEYILRSQEEFKQREYYKNLLSK